MVQAHALADDYGADVQVELGAIDEIRPLPRISIQAFCETEAVAQALEACTRDRRTARTHLKVHMGGVPAAAEFYQTAPTPNLIVVESRHQPRELLGALSRLAEVVDSETRVMVIGHYNDITLYRELIGNGVSDYLVAPISMADFLTAVSHIFVNPETGPIGKIIAFIGAKGGCGSSTICHNVAWTISSRYRNDVLLTDLDLAFGTANINLDQDPAQGVAEAVFSPDRMDDILLDRLLAKCAEHLSLLAAPSTLERTYDFDRNAFSGILEVAQRSAPLVVVDLPHMWTGWTKQVLASADEVVITANPELANLRNAKNLLDTLKELRPNDRPARLVMNMVGVPKRPEISVNDFVAPLGVTPAAIIPFDAQLFGTASNNGQMISEADPKNPVSGIFDALAQGLTGRAALKPEKKSGLNILSVLRRKKA